MMKLRLQNKVAVVTGAAAGLGRAVALGFSREGARVVACDLDEAQGADLVRTIKAAGGEASFVRADVSAEEDARKLATETLDHYGRIDVLYNNAAILLAQREARVHELEVAVWDRTLAVNLRGYFLCSKFVLPAMLKQGGGSIIHVGSPCGIRGFSPLTAYSASKGGVIGLTRVMAASYAADKIRVNAIVPGTMDTQMNAGDETLHRQLCADIPLGRLGTGEDLAGLAIFLASDESSYCTGSFYTCDGGLTAI